MSQWKTALSSQLNKGKTMLKIVYYTDPGHGWFAVKHSTLKTLGIFNLLSTYSYTKGKTAYLEEDCDASLLFKALHLNGIEYTTVEKHCNKRSPIRSYMAFNPVRITL